jgi:hypothetical protein
MDANGKPIDAVTVSTNFKGHRKNIVQKRINENHERTPVFVGMYLTNKERAAREKAKARGY